MSENRVADRLRACATLSYGSVLDKMMDEFGTCSVRDFCNRAADEIDADEAEMRGFCKRVEEAAKNMEDLDVFGVEYMPLPLDKNGEPWHVGDRIETYRGVMREVVYVGEESVVTINGRDDCELLAASHYAHKESTVESVLKELIAEACGDSSPDDETIAKYAAKLRLKES